MEERKLALLIDSDNVSVKYLNGIFDELAQYGIITYRRIYGDFTSHLNARWSDRLLEKSIIPIQQFSNTTGKNATDSALIIDAMDLLYTSNVDGFCIVSSDSDFTRLASRLRESGKIVIGMGEKKTPDSFRAACTIFTELENLIEDEKNAKATNREAIEADIINIIMQNDNRGKATGSGEIGSKLQNKYPDFDIRSFGYSQLSKFLEDMPALVLRNENNTIMVSLKEESGEDPVIRDIVEIVKTRGGHSMSLATLGQEIRRRHRNFNVALYGYSQLYAFIDSLPGLSVVGERTERRVMYNGEDATSRTESSSANAASGSLVSTQGAAANAQRQM
ncbi:MAG: NYN domain-containing protein, partial [bacterium]